MARRRHAKINTGRGPTAAERRASLREAKRFRKRKVKRVRRRVSRKRRWIQKAHLKKRCATPYDGDPDEGSDLGFRRAFRVGESHARPDAQVMEEYRAHESVVGEVSPPAANGFEPAQGKEAEALVGRRCTAFEREVSQKSDAQIERETAEKWANRAIDCYAEYSRTNAISWLLRADGYRHEALEHASTVGDRGATVRRVQDRIDREMRALGVGKAVESRRGTTRGGRRRR